MNILYTRDYGEIDGTYLLLLRLSKKFAALGHNVYYLHYENDDPGILTEISKHATLLSFADLQRKYAAGEKLPEIDVIQPILNGDRLVEAITVIKGKWFPKARFVIGIYHPRTFIDRSKLGLTADSKVYASILKKIGNKNLIIMHDSMMKSHNEHLKVNISGAHLINLPVEIPAAPVLRKGVNRYKIVSIGRLVAWKSYNYTLLDTLKKLRNEGHPFEYFIYGDGPDKDTLVTAIEAAGLGEAVHLMGTIPPAQMQEILADAGLFVGVGTALIEAAGWCVPSLVGIESNKKDTAYGWIATVPDSLGDVMPGKQEHSFYSLLSSYLGLTDAGYDQLCADCYATVKDHYSIDSIAQQYLSVYENADPDFNFKMSQLSKFALRFLRQLHKPFTDKNFATK